MQEATPEMVKQWKLTWSQYKNKLRPNRKTGAEIVAYVTEKYTLIELCDERTKLIVIENVLQNEPFAEKIPKGKQPLPIAFIVENAGKGQKLYREQDEIFKGHEILLGVELESGFFYVEGSSLLWDELCAFQGLDAQDIQNPFCVHQYVFALERFGLLDSILSK